MTRRSQAVSGTWGKQEVDLACVPQAAWYEWLALEAERIQKVRWRLQQPGMRGRQQGTSFGAFWVGGECLPTHVGHMWDSPTQHASHGFWLEQLCGWKHYVKSNRKVCVSQINLPDISEKACSKATQTNEFEVHKFETLFQEDLVARDTTFQASC